MTRQARLFAIAEYLRGRRTGATAQAIAERFGVTLRTVYRDLAALRLAELPLHAERGRGGGYALDRHYTLPPVNLNAREAAVLVALGTYGLRMRLLPYYNALAHESHLTGLPIMRPLMLEFPEDARLRKDALPRNSHPRRLRNQPSEISPAQAARSPRRICLTCRHAQSSG